MEKLKGSKLSVALHPPATGRVLLHFSESDFGARQASPFVPVSGSAVAGKAADKSSVLRYCVLPEGTMSPDAELWQVGRFGPSVLHLGARIEDGR